MKQERIVLEGRLIDERVHGRIDRNEVGVGSVSVERVLDRLVALLHRLTHAVQPERHLLAQTGHVIVSEQTVERFVVVARVRVQEVDVAVEQLEVVGDYGRVDEKCLKWKELKIFVITSSFDRSVINFN